MKELIFSKNFNFKAFNYKKYHHVDNRAGIVNHCLAYMQKGYCKIVSQDTTLYIKAGDVFYIPKGLSYQSYWHSKDSTEFLSFGFHFFPESETKSFPLQKIDCSDEIKTQIMSLPVSKNNNSYVYGAFYSVLAAILPYLEYVDHAPYNSIIKKAEKFIYNNTDCKVSDIARHCLLSESALYHIFKKQAGFTPNELIQKIRCEKAISMLTKTDKSIQEISDALNFSSTSYFRKIIYKYTAKTPRQIRQLAKRI